MAFELNIIIWTCVMSSNLANTLLNKILNICCSKVSRLNTILPHLLTGHRTVNVCVRACVSACVGVVQS